MDSVMALKGKKYWLRATDKTFEGVIKVVNDEDFMPTTEMLVNWLPHYKELVDRFYPLATSEGYCTSPDLGTEVWVAFRYLFTSEEMKDKVSPLGVYYVPCGWFKDNTFEL